MSEPLPPPVTDDQYARCRCGAILVTTRINVMHLNNPMLHVANLVLCNKCSYVGTAKVEFKYRMKITEGQVRRAYMDKKCDLFTGDELKSYAREYNADKCVEAPDVREEKIF